MDNDRNALLRAGTNRTIAAKVDGQTVTLPIIFSVEKGRDGDWCYVENGVWDNFFAPTIAAYKATPQNPIIGEILDEWEKSHNPHGPLLVDPVLKNVWTYFPVAALNQSIHNPSRFMDDKVFVAMADLMASAAAKAEQRGLEKPECAPFLKIAETIATQREKQHRIRALVARGRRRQKLKKITIAAGLGILATAIIAYNILSDPYRDASEAIREPVKKPKPPKQKETPVANPSGTEPKLNPRSDTFPDPAIIVARRQTNSRVL
ncbi:MAG: hypothetical protein EYC62_03615 [Alphaproteobacteria bacterium]|nr:MAG: hypothetical protein EYC62_03615 [Alphaproteobacteria bacterium]